MKLDFLGMPFLFKGSVMIQNLMDHCQNVTGTLRVVCGRISRLTAGCFIYHLPIYCDLK
jgi:hypothetical protein